MVGPNPLKKDLSPKPLKGWALETKGARKKPSLSKSKKSKGSPVIRTGPRYLGTARGSGSLGDTTKLG